MKESVFLSIAFILFALTFFLSFILLYKKTFYKWKINLAFTLSYLTFLIVTISLLSLTKNFKIMIIFGSIFMPPFTTYQVISTKYYINKNKNIQKIILKK